MQSAPEGKFNAKMQGAKSMGIVRRLRAIVRQRCPRCGQGRVFRGCIAMNESCPTCALRFEREPGYFTAAMYFSYALAVPLLVVLAVVIRWATGWPYLRVGLAAAVLQLVAVPAVFRYSRILWLHVDHAIQPEA